MASGKSKGKAAAIHLIYGNDESAVKRAASERAAALMPEDTMNFETLDGQASLVDEAMGSIDELRAAVLTLPFFGGGKLVWWKSVNFLNDTMTGRSERVKEALARFQDEVLPQIDGVSVTLLVSALGLHRGRSFPKALLKVAAAEEHSLPDLRELGEEGLRRLIEQEMRQAGLDPDEGAVERLFYAVGANFGQMRSEIDKLTTYLGGEKAVTRDDVQAVVGGRREVLIWDFCDAVVLGKPKTALALLSSLLQQGESDVGILILLSNQVRMAALGSTLAEAQLLNAGSRFAKLSAETESLLPKKKSGEPIHAANLARVAGQARRRPASFWHRALDTLYHAHGQMVSGVGDKVRTLERAVLEVAS